MAATPVQAVIEAMESAFGGFHPDAAVQMETFFQELPGMFESAAKQLNGVAENADSEFPISSKVTEALREFAATLAGLHDGAKELEQTFRREHKEDLDRIHNPRTGERAWDYQTNQ